MLRKEEKDILGESREYLTIKILHNDMTVMVPTENAALAGLRRVIDEETVKKVLAVLQDECSEMPKNWNRRFKHNRDKIKTGDIYELAEVVRNLAIREAEKGLSTGEKQMFTRAKKILASELMYALEMDEERGRDAPLRELLSQHATATERQGGRRREVASAGRTNDGGRVDRGRRTWRAPWVRPAQGARQALPAGRCWSGASTALRSVAAVSAIVVALPPDELACAPAGTVAVAGGAVRSQSVREGIARLRRRRSGDRPRCGTASGRCRAIRSARSPSSSESGADAVIAAAPVSDTIKESRRRRSHGRGGLSTAAVCGRFRRPRYSVATRSSGRCAGVRGGPRRRDRRRLARGARPAGSCGCRRRRAENIKVTTPIDLRLAELLLASRAVTAPGGSCAWAPTGLGYDCHRFAEGRRLVLGGVEIPHERGLTGHSDADVLIHAIIDALLGAAAMGDIGHHFPDTDERYRGADSLELLRATVRCSPTADSRSSRRRHRRARATEACPVRDQIRAALAQALVCRRPCEYQGDAR